MRQERAEAKAAEKPTRATIRRTKKAPTENDEDPAEEDHGRSIHTWHHLAMSLQLR